MRACLLSVLLVIVSGTLVGCAGQKAAKESGSRSSKTKAKSAARHTSRDAQPSADVASEAPEADRRWAKHGEAEMAPAAPSQPTIPGYQAGTLTAGSFDDHENFADYQAYLDGAASTAHSYHRKHVGRVGIPEDRDRDR